MTYFDDVVPLLKLKINLFEHTVRYSIRMDFVDDSDEIHSILFSSVYVSLDVPGTIRYLNECMQIKIQITYIGYIN